MAALLVVACFYPKAQGYNKGYWLTNTGGTSFNAMSIRNDSIYIVGVLRDTSGSLPYLPCFAIFNIDSQYYFNSYTRLDSVEAINPGKGMLLDSDNIVITAGGTSAGHFATNISIIEKYKTNGTLYARSIYSDTLNDAQAFFECFKISGAGYFALGTEQYRTGNNSIYYYSFDDSLNLISRKFLLPYRGDACENITQVVQLDSNQFLICGSQYSCTLHSEITHLMLLKINSNGDTISTWVDDEQDSLIIYDLFPTINGGYIAGGIKLDSINPIDHTRYYDAVIACLDSSFNRLWLRRCGVNNFYNTEVNKVIKVDTTSFLVSGIWYENYNDKYLCWYQYAFIEKHNTEDGSLIWRRNYKNLADTSCYPVGGRWDENKLHDITILPDHSIVACGEFINWADTSHPQQGWLIKVNEYGCFSADCSDTTWMNSVSTIPSQNIKMSIFPNPASDQVAVEIINRGDAINDASLTVYEMSGQLVHSYAHINTQTTYFLNIKNYAAGNYILRLEEHGLLLGTANLMKE
jgi:Secretion system C-terminal sorting domain